MTDYRPGAVLMTAEILEFGDSVVIIFPPEVLLEAGLVEGMTVDIVAIDGTIHLTPIGRKEPSAEEEAEWQAITDQVHAAFG